MECNEASYTTKNDIK